MVGYLTYFCTCKSSSWRRLTNMHYRMLPNSSALRVTLRLLAFSSAVIRNCLDLVLQRNSQARVACVTGFAHQCLADAACNRPRHSCGAQWIGRDERCWNRHVDTCAWHYSSSKQTAAEHAPECEHLGAPGNQTAAQEDSTTAVKEKADLEDFCQHCCSAIVFVVYTADSLVGLTRAEHHSPEPNQRSYCINHTSVRCDSCSPASTWPYATLPV
jgi:hypothetical protein